jgi:hypothetical protein
MLFSIPDVVFFGMEGAEMESLNSRAQKHAKAIIAGHRRKPRRSRIFNGLNVRFCLTGEVWPDPKKTVN